MGFILADRCGSKAGHCRGIQTFHHDPNLCVTLIVSASTAPATVLCHSAAPWCSSTRTVFPQQSPRSAPISAHLKVEAVAVYIPSALYYSFLFLSPAVNANSNQWALEMAGLTCTGLP
jgi:hypothetical protein